MELKDQDKTASIVKPTEDQRTLQDHQGDYFNSYPPELKTKAMRLMEAYKPAEEITELEAKEYCEEYAKQNQSSKNFVEMSLRDGDSYKQIAYFLMTN